MVIDGRESSLLKIKRLIKASDGLETQFNTQLALLTSPAQLKMRVIGPLSLRRLIL